jgi:SAM-dependent methyltransferase
MLPNGQVRPAMYHKFRQINRYLEFVDDLLPHLPTGGCLNIVDFGCGKSYLTFALHYLLTRIHRREVSIVGLDIKQDVIADCTRIADILDCQGLRFQVGRIESFQPQQHVHLAVSLHACDTATDDALAGAIRWQCDAIMAVPCCQHELNATIPESILPGLTEYGIFRDRFAAMATDALRARLLDVHGYRTQVLEFIELEHTPKNVLLRAVRRPAVSEDESAVRRQAYDRLKADLGIQTWRLEAALSN